MAAKRQRLAQRRKSLGFTQEQLADRLGVDITTVRRWESGDTAGGPQPWLRPKLARCLQVSPEQLDGLLDAVPVAVEAATAVAVQSAASPSVLVPVIVDGQPVLVPIDGQRAETLGLTVSGAEPTLHTSSAIPASAVAAAGMEDVQRAAVVLSGGPDGAGGSLVSYFDEQLVGCMTTDGLHGPARALPAVLGLLAAIDQGAAHLQPSLRRDLLSVAARGAEFAGWLYRDSGDAVQARNWYDRATAWAQEAGNLPLQGYILLRKSQMAYDERDAARVLLLAQAALEGPWQLEPVVRAEATQQEARGLAMLGEPLDLVQQRLDAAAELFAAGGVTGQENSHTVALRTASCYIEAGKPREAAELYDQALAKDGLSCRDRGYFTARMATALALAGEPDAAATTGLQAVDVIAATGSHRTRREIERTLLSLGPWRSRPGPQALRDALAG